MSKRPTIRPTPCLGILGKLFGHKFTHGGYNRAFSHCLRCGTPAGSIQVMKTMTKGEDHLEYTRP